MMRFKLLSLLLIVVLSACSFQVTIIETPVPSATSVVVPSTSTPFPTAENSATPSSTSIALPTVEVVSSVPAGAVARIVFPANGTAQILPGDLPAGASQTYSLNAFKGQVMTVSVWAETENTQNTFALEIKGQDGTVLCPISPDPCPFWRGELPTTQDYFIKVTANVGGAFKMQVAINPPGEAHQYFSYQDPQGRYSLSYSDEFAPMKYAGVSVFPLPTEFALQYVDTEQYMRTNLSEAYLLINSSTDPQVVPTCTALDSVGGLGKPLDNVTIKGISFAQRQIADVGAGNIYEQILHRAVHQGTCYEVIYFMHYTNIGNYDPGTITEFDRDALLQKFDETLATLVLK